MKTLAENKLGMAPETDQMLSTVEGASVEIVLDLDDPEFEVWDSKIQESTEFQPLEDFDTNSFDTQIDFPCDYTEEPFDLTQFPGTPFDLLQPTVLQTTKPIPNSHPLTRAGTFEQNISRRPS